MNSTVCWIFNDSIIWRIADCCDNDYVFSSSSSNNYSFWWSLRYNFDSFLISDVSETSNNCKSIKCACDGADIKIQYAKFGIVM